MKKKTKLTLFLIFILVLGTDLALSQEDYSRDEYRLLQRFKVADKFFEKGKQFFLERSYKKAEKELNKCLEKMPEHADAYLFLSQISYFQGDLDQAENFIKKAKENYKYIIELKMNREQLFILRLQERKREVMQTIEALKQKLSQTTDRNAQEKIKAEIGRMEGLIGSIDSQMSRPTPTLQKEEGIPADYFYIHGNIFFKQKKFQEAHEQYQRAVEIDPGHGNAYNNLANLYYMANEYQKALDCLNLAEKNGVKINPEFKKAILKGLKKSP